MRRGWLILSLALLGIVWIMYGCANKYETTGKIDMNAKRWDKAMISFNKALEVNPANAKVHYYLAKIYAEKQNYPLMAQHLNSADSLDPKLNIEVSKLRDSTWFVLAGAADSAMNEVPAIEKEASSYFETALGQIAANQPDSAAKNFERSRANLRIRNNTKAEEAFDQAVEKAKAGQPDEAKASFDSAMFAATSGIFTEAKNKFETAILISPNKPEAYAKAGFAWFKLANDDSSFYYYKKAHDLAPDNVEILRNLARVALTIGKMDIVDALFAQLLEKDPSNVEGWVVRGNIANDAGRFDDAVKYYTTALGINKDQCNVWFSLGVIYFQKMQKLDDAEQAFTQAANLCPEDVNTLINLNVVLITNNKLDEAISRLIAYTEKYPKDCTGWDLLSQALLRKGQKEQAYAANKKYEDCKNAQ